MKRLIIISILLLTAITLLAYDFKDTAAFVYVRLTLTIEDLYTGRTYDTEAIVSGSGYTIYSGTRGWEGMFDSYSLLTTNYHVVEYVLNPDALKTNLETYSTLGLWEEKNGKLVPFEIDDEMSLITDAKAEGPFITLYQYWKKTGKLLYETKVDIVSYDEWLDVAILKLPNVTTLATIKWADECEMGDDIQIFGAPLGLPFQLTKGTLGQKNFDAADGWEDMLRYDCAQAPGSSGSAIMNENGELIGMVRGSFVDSWGSHYDGQHLGIDAANIKDWLLLSGYDYIFE